MVLEAASARDIYRENVARYRETLTRECGLLGADYHLLTTDQPLDFALFQFLASRTKHH
jgi:hypothetical protein